MKGNCVLCGGKGCKFCIPNIPDWYLKAIPSSRRTQEQVEAVCAGLHPTGNEEAYIDGQKCGACRFRQHVPGSTNYKWCVRAKTEWHRLTTIYMNSCVHYEEGDEIQGTLFELYEIEL